MIDVLDPIIVQLGSLDNVGSAGLITKALPLKNTHYGMFLSCAKSGGLMTEAEICTHIGNVKLVMTDTVQGNVILVDATATEIFADFKDRNAAKSGYTPAGVLPIEFTRDRLPKGYTTQGVPYDISPRTLGVGMANATSFTLTIQQLAPGSFIMTGVDLSVEVDQGPERPLGEYVSFQGWDHNFSTTGAQMLRDTIFGEKDTALLSVTLGDATLITNVAVKADNTEVLPATVPAFNNLLAHINRRTPQSGYFTIDFQRNRKFLEMTGVKSMLYTITWGTAPNAYRMLTTFIRGLGKNNAL